MMEAARTSETSVDNHFTRQYNPEDSSEHIWGSSGVPYSEFENFFHSFNAYHFPHTRFFGMSRRKGGMDCPHRRVKLLLDVPLPEIFGLYDLHTFPVAQV
jgi:hypothetical protein